MLKVKRTHKMPEELANAAYEIPQMEMITPRCI